MNKIFCPRLLLILAITPPHPQAAQAEAPVCCLLGPAPLAGLAGGPEAGEGPFISVPLNGAWARWAGLP